MIPKEPVGLILAGGMSQRMGEDKARICFHGIPMLARARKLLELAGIHDVIVLGPPSDRLHQDAYPGPARAICNWLQAQVNTQDILVIPVDMPALKPETLALLRSVPGGAYFQNQYLPFYAPCAQLPAHEAPPARMLHLVEALRLKALDIPSHLRQQLTNVNTPGALEQLEAVTKPNNCG
ncbi:molybdenum cofactor guanylyltransferase [Kordiimonas aestuarii]|uniref:molybdenum cofactor guanylyltransferase n=1 Tax=Kordiimonas aestuarii TaxID=1005925 RepID=UPI0021CF8343|nr:NTP transferase domain-containing protein [Kordiimonas aestuarii]